MRIGLILPRGVFVAQNTWMADFMDHHPESFRPWMIPSCGLLTIAALTPVDAEFDYVDEQVEDVDFDQPYDIVALSGMTQQASRAYAIAREFRRRGVYTVMGGAHATVVPEEVLEHFDTVMVGEAEGAWEAFIRDYLAGTPQRRYRNDSLESIDLLGSPAPRYDLLGERFFANGRGYKMMPVQTTRGCPRDCEFCSVPQVYGKAFRKKSVEQVVRDVRAAQAAAPGQLVLFADDNMFIHRRFSHELLEALTPLKIRYMAQSDIGIAEDERLLELMYQSGCVMVLVGLESLSPKALKQVDGYKSRMLDKYREYVQRIQDHGMIVLGAFIVGLDHDDSSVFERIEEFVHATQVTPQITIATPLPRTAMTARLEAEGRLPAGNYWDRCTYYDAIHEPAGLTASELERGVAALHWELFSSSMVAKRRGHMRRVLRGLGNRYQAESLQPAATLP